MPQRTLAVIDGNSLIHRAFHALPPTMTAPDGRPTNAAFGFISMLAKMMADLKPDGVVVAFDLGKPAFRMEALAQYKMQRPPTAQELRDQFPMVKDLLKALEIPIVELQGWEGDDILGTLARQGEQAGIRMLLVTGDRDAFQLVTDTVKVVTTKKGITDIVIYGRDEVFERYGVTPEQVPDYLGLKGDTSDNIPGVPGIGEKTAAKLIQQYGSLDEVLAHADEVPGKVGENLRANTAEAIASRTVATIRTDVPVECEIEQPGQPTDRLSSAGPVAQRLDRAQTRRQRAVVAPHRWPAYRSGARDLDHECRPRSADHRGQRVRVGAGQRSMLSSRCNDQHRARLDRRAPRSGRAARH